ncbi:hypothetical protein MCAP1_002089 [Malassezia caprae]|uniref:Uncharacterized protein n=1 Tax=Malassezia caprae TaxID=1381934 RepID=A0AAF0E7T9_9BASI|nr:hypothetical protein MCAP1_002089 [Malassezia caprae]
MTTPAWQAFHASHFEDADRRAWFAAHLAHGYVPAIPPAPQGRLEQEDAWTQLAPGEHEADWQQRHGVQYLTPGSARIFDASRRFREERSRAEDAHAEGAHVDDGQAQDARAQEAHAHSATGRSSPDTPNTQDLAALRARALEALSRGRTA